MGGGLEAGQEPRMKKMVGIRVEPTGVATSNRIAREGKSLPLEYPLRARLLLQEVLPHKAAEAETGLAEETLGVTQACISQGATKEIGSTSLKMTQTSESGIGLIKSTTSRSTPTC